MIIAHFNNKLIAYVNTGITACPKSSQSPKPTHYRNRAHI
jgi:hypothetical protein